jgi:biopolymer transport protein ExbD
MSRPIRIEPQDEIPTSSMADIAFLLIIFFMLTMTFAASRGLDFKLPKDEPQQLEIVREDAILLEIRADGQLLIDQQEVVAAILLETLAKKLARNAKKPVILQPDPAASYGSMVEVFDLLRQGREVLRLKEDINVVLPTAREVAMWSSLEASR